jgi:16S rRNA C967 or C1407 C5-methylase (RsmB/RsmF family)/NOL1/NOP2/fmu family ribosome biogenesis protein
MILLPESFENRMKMILGPEFPKFNHSFSEPVAHSIRINPKKYSKESDLEPVSTCTTGYYLRQRPIYTLDPLLHAGVYYVQESSSMVLEQFVRQYPRKNLRVLDLCAAPGGKSTHLSALLSEDSLLVCNEVIHSRAQVLSENLKKWGNPNVVVTCNDPRDFSRLPGFFDMIVVDAPCSGEGLFHRDPSAMNEWSDANAAHCAQRQKRILADVWPALAENGMLVYSTCTFNPAENEENIKWLTEFAPVEAINLDVPDNWNIVTTQAGTIPCYRFYPHLVKGEGFFTAAVLKKERINKEFRSKNKATLPLAGKSEQSALKGLIRNYPVSLLKFAENFLAFPTELLSALDQVKSSLRIVHAGVKIGEIKQGSVVPSHELAVSTIVDHTHFPAVDLTLEQSINFLKRDEFPLEFNERGWNLLTYLNHPLGWAKNIGSRFNNGYPKEWRIRMSTTDYSGEKLAEEAAKFPKMRDEI